MTESEVTKRVDDGGDDVVRSEFVVQPSATDVVVETHAGGFNPKRVRFMVYGESGSGKTVFAATWPKPIFLDIDQGMASIKHEVARIPVGNWAELQNAYMYLAYSKHNYETAVIDSLNEGQWQAMQNVISTYSTVRRAYDNLPGMGDYGKSMDDFDKFVRVMRALPMNVVFIAQVAPRDSEEQMVQPQFTGKATARNIARMMDEIGYLYKADSSEPVKPRIMVFDDSKFTTKDRSDSLPAFIENPTYEKLAIYWRK
jgi:calcineurin-like phosphoesterase family protein